MEALRDFYKSKAEQFLKTVVCFDDQAYEEAQTNTNLVANLPDNGFADSGDDYSIAV